MPKNLTDVSQWATVTAPVGTDPATAASVETPLQILADRARFLLRGVLSLRATNWLPSDVSAIGGTAFCNAANAMAITYDATDDRFLAVDEDGAMVFTYPAGYTSPPASPAGGPLLWNDHTADPLDGARWVASGVNVDIASGGGVAIAVSDSAATQVERCAGGPAGAWAAQTPAGAGVLWQRCSYDPGSGLFFIAGRAGTPIQVDTSPDGTTWTSRTVAAGFTVTPDNVTAIASDPAGVGGTLILSATERSHTLDGLTYSAGAHGLATAPLALAYAGTGRWVAILTSGDVAYSEDDGATWTVVTAPLVGFAATNVRLASDGHGGLVGSAWGAGTAFLWASTDAGATWDRVFNAAMYNAMESGPAFGGGHFAAIGCRTGGTVAAMHSLRMLEV